MDKKRAKKIAASPIMANVTHNGTSVYIEKVNEKKGTANIHSLNSPDQKQEVDLTSLTEQGMK